MSTHKSNPPRWFWPAVSVILLATVLLRFLFLADKPFHHDESLHAYYSHQIASGGRPYEYQALLHGPFLYFFVGAIQFIGGLFGHVDSDFVARFPAALFGTISVAMPLLLLPIIGSLSTIFMMVFLCISPTIMYFGRFLREDVFVSVWVLGTVFGIARFLHFRLTDRMKSDSALIFSAAMLAFHFVNKENSYIHLVLWALAIISGVAFLRLFPDKENTRASTYFPPVAALVASASLFTSIYVIFYSSFFQHSRGWIAGVLDGLYRESLLYWWGQNKVRRVDGAFDYHFPIIANYEFLLLPFLVAAWIRAVRTSRAFQQVTPFFLTAGRLYRTLWIVAGLLVAAVAFLPRVALDSRACEYSDIPCQSLPFVPQACDATHEGLACSLHIATSRHLLQILAMVFFGGVAFLSCCHTRRRKEAFVWFWLTGALGAYSYVGEKVPWLTIYLIIPILLLAALEAARAFQRTPLDSDDVPDSGRYPRIAIAWLAVAGAFTMFKSVRASFVDPANPAERLVFTQTTQVLANLRHRWDSAQERAGRPTRVAVFGDATWPLAWYMQPYKGSTFLREPSTNDPQYQGMMSGQDLYDAVFLDLAHLDFAKANLRKFDIYRVPLRAWWVPGPNPTVPAILSYFFTRTLYERPGYGSGLGSSDVLYLERHDAQSPFAHLPLLAGDSVQLLAQSSN